VSFQSASAQISHPRTASASVRSSAGVYIRACPPRHGVPITLSCLRREPGAAHPTAGHRLCHSWALSSGDQDDCSGWLRKSFCVSTDPNRLKPFLSSENVLMEHPWRLIVFVAGLLVGGSTGLVRSGEEMNRKAHRPGTASFLIGIFRPQTGDRHRAFASFRMVED
jgi:hypothetical protein